MAKMGVFLSWFSGSVLVLVFKLEWGVWGFWGEGYGDVVDEVQVQKYFILIPLPCNLSSQNDQQFNSPFNFASGKNIPMDCYIPPSVLDTNCWHFGAIADFLKLFLPFLAPLLAIFRNFVPILGNFEQFLGHFFCLVVSRHFVVVWGLFAPTLTNLPPLKSTPSPPFMTIPSGFFMNEGDQGRLRAGIFEFCFFNVPAEHM